MDVLDILSSGVACSRLFRSAKWQDGVFCPRCGSGEASRLSLRDWFMLMLLFLGLHNSSLGLSWLLERSCITVFKAVKRLMFSISKEAQSVKMGGAVESEEIYVTAGLKGRNNSHRIKRLGRKPRRKGLKRRGRGTWNEDKPAVFILVGGAAQRTMSHPVTLRLRRRRRL